MLGNLFTGWHLLIILAVVLLVFGATRLPQLAKGVGQSIRIFRGEMKSIGDDEPAAPAETTSAESATKQ